MIVGSGNFIYEVDEGWGSYPSDCKLGWVAAVAVDSKDRVYIYSRSAHPLVRFARDGTFIDSLAQEILVDAHGILIDERDRIFCVEREAHCMRQLDSDGRLVATLGTPGVQGAEGEPFRLPTDIAFDSVGDMYISDGYDNARIHKYTAAGELIKSWGSPGSGPGEFDLPHCVRVDKNDRVLVCDRSNNRVQIFDTEGVYLTQWTDLNQPDTIHIDEDDIVYIAELDQRISILNLEGELLCRWGKGERLDEPGEFLGCPHGIWTDSVGDLYVSEVQADQRVQKFIRQR
jgi:DNA-binding beta-propeller fold protein YncE